MQRPLFLAILILWACVQDTRGRARYVNAPNGEWTFDLTRSWARRSQLGDLQNRPMAPNDIELRVWSGYGEPPANSPAFSGLILRREGGKWSAWRAEPTLAARPTDSLIVNKINTQADLAQVWQTAVAKGALKLPQRVPRKWGMMDGGSYVVEVRTGSNYRASSIEDVSPPEVDADRQVKDVYDAVFRPLFESNPAR